MLANGAKLKYKKSGESDYTELKGLKTIADMGIDKEKVENTCLSDSVKQYEYGIGDYADLSYTFKYENTASSSYRVLRGFSDSGEVVSFEQEFKDGTKFQFDAQCNVKLSGGGVNEVIEFTLELALQSDVAVVDPA